MNKQIKILLIIAIVSTIVYLILKHILRMKKDLKNVNSINEALQDIKSLYGVEIARNVEKIYRLETNNFKSKQYKNSGSAGMIKHTENFPYGWTSISEFWSLHNKLAPVGVWTWQNSDNQTFNYLKFNNFGGFYSLAEFLNHYDNYAPRWNSLDIAQQQRYQEALDNINTTFV